MIAPLLRRALLTALLLAAGCGRSLPWTFSVEDPVASRDIVVFEAEIREGSCDGEAIYEATFRRDETPPLPPALEAQTYGFSMVGRDALCRPVAEGCAPLDAASEGDAHVSLAALSPRGAGCGVDERCDEGVCVPECPCATDVREGGRCSPAATRRAVAVTAGALFTCALRADANALYCWGRNDDAELGLGLGVDVDAPTRITATGVDWVALDAGDRAVCGVRASQLHCWGWNRFGQVGLGDDAGATVTPDHYETPTEVPLVSGTPVEVSLSKFHGCTCTADGRVDCWGSNAVFAAFGATTDRVLPAAFSGVSADALYTGVHRTCVLRGGSLECVGYTGADQLGPRPATGPALHTLTPIAPSLSVRDVALGPEHTCAITDDGALYCWGCGGICEDCDPINVSGGSLPYDCRYALGFATDAATVADPLAGRVPGAVVQAVDASYHTCVIADDGEGDGAGPVSCFGPNEFGQLGDGTTARHGFDAGSRLLEGARFTDVAVGDYHSCAIRDDGALFCWGRNDEGQTLPGGDRAVAHPRPERVCLDD